MLNSVSGIAEWVSLEQMLYSSSYEFYETCNPSIFLFSLATR